MNIGINCDLFFPIYKQAWALTYTAANVASAFKKCGIVPFNPCPVLSQLSLPTAASRATAQNYTEGFPFENTPYTKCELWQQTNRALTKLKTANPREVCQLILRFSHTAEYMAVQADIANAKAQQARKAVEKIGTSKKDLRHLGKGNLTGVMTGEGILDVMQECDKKDSLREKAVKKAEKATCAKKPAQAAPTSGPITPVPVRVCPPSRVRFQLIDTPTRILRSATRSIPRLNYFLPPLPACELQDNSDLESFISAASSDWEYCPRTSTAPEEIPNAPQLGTPLSRRLRSSK